MTKREEPAPQSPGTPAVAGGSGIKKTKSQAGAKLIGISIALYLCMIWAVAIADTKIVWLPWDVVLSIANDIQYYVANPAKAVPDEVALSSDLPVDGFVEKQFIPALEIVNREPEFKYLADMVVKYKIPILMGKEEDFRGWENMAMYQYACPGKPIGKVLINPANTYNNLSLAGHLVHELTHAYDKVSNPDYYCNEKKYLSGELHAFKNATVFGYQFNHFSFFALFTGGLIDLRGNPNEYCIYYKIKTTPIYSDYIDDLNLIPSPGSDEEIICHVALFK